MIHIPTSASTLVENITRFCYQKDIHKAINAMISLESHQIHADPVTYTELIKCCIHRGTVQQPTNSYAALFTLKACSSLPDPQTINHVHAHLSKIGLHKGIHSSTAWISSFAIRRASSPKEACKIGLHKGIHSSTAWISSFAIRRASSPKEALHLYREMQRQGVPTNSYAALFTLKACSSLPDPQTINHVHAHLCKIGLNCHVYVATALLNRYNVCSLDDALQLFEEMPERTVVTWNSMVTGYSKFGNVIRARELFDTMPTRDIVSWSAMIASYMDNGKCIEGLSLFRLMMINKMLRPDEVTIVTLLSGWTDLEPLGLLGKSIHAYIVKSGWAVNVVLGTALIDMYAKCGFLQNAARLFDMLEDRNVMTWSALIGGLASHGCGNQAISMFEKMKEANVRPNEFTFTGILNACSNAGLVAEGQKNFYSMINEYELEPRIQHYGCMVDLLGKAGLLNEAYELIKTMKIEPNIVVWSSFLAACKMHRCFDMADKVIERVLDLASPDRDGGVYTLISDLYALKGKWRSVEQVRELMLDKNVKKVRGSSFIEVEQPSRSLR